MNSIIEGNILDASGGIICHQVNCQRIMGAGLALQIARTWPHVREAYESKPVWRLGDCQIVQAAEGIYVANLAGQFDCGPGLQTDYEGLEQALTLAVDQADRVLDLPLLLPYGMGCGLAGGDWDGVVAPMINRVAPGAVIYKYDPSA